MVKEVSRNYGRRETMSKVALAMIVKGEGDEYKDLDRCLKSVVQYVDGIYITLTGEGDVSKTEKVCKKYNVNVSKKSFYQVSREEGG